MNLRLTPNYLLIIPGFFRDYLWIIPESLDFLRIILGLSPDYTLIFPGVSLHYPWIIPGIICQVSKQEKASYCYLKLFDH